jgi:hypothetical protein
MVTFQNMVEAVYKKLLLLMLPTSDGTKWENNGQWGYGYTSQYLKILGVKLG